MIPLSQFRAQQRAARLEQEKARKLTRYRVDLWLLGVEEKRIEPVDVVNRDRVRGAVRWLVAQAVDLACDNCGTRLFNPEPGMWLASSPLQARLVCPGCGATEHLTESEYAGVVRHDWLAEEAGL